MSMLMIRVLLQVLRWYGESRVAPERPITSQMSTLLRTTALMMSAAPASGMAFGLRSIGRRITMSAKGRGVIYEDITKTVH